MLNKLHKFYGGHKLPFTPGAIPKGKPRLAKAVGTIVANDLLTEEDINKENIFGGNREWHCESDNVGIIKRY